MICITGKDFQRSVNRQCFKAFQDDFPLVKEMLLDQYSPVVLTALCDYVDQVSGGRSAMRLCHSKKDSEDSEEEEPEEYEHDDEYDSEYDWEEDAERKEWTIDHLDRYLRCNMTKQQRMFSARLNLPALVQLANVCLYLDFDELMHLCMGQIAYCLLRGHEMELLPKYHSPKPYRIWPGDVVWSAYFKVKDALAPVLAGWLACDPAMLLKSDPVPYAFLYRTGLSKQKLFELAVTESDLVDLDYFHDPELVPGPWTHPLIQFLQTRMELSCRRALAVWRRYVSRMPLHMMRISYESTLRYREAIRACSELPLVDPAWLRRDWITMRELLQRVTLDDLKWVFTVRFLNSFYCMSMAVSFLPKDVLREAYALGLVTDKHEPFIAPSVDNTNFHLFVDTPDYDALDAEAQETVKKCLSLNLPKYRLYHRWAVLKGAHRLLENYLWFDARLESKDLLLDLWDMKDVFEKVENYYDEWWMHRDCPRNQPIRKYLSRDGWFDLDVHLDDDFLSSESRNRLVEAIIAHPNTKYEYVTPWFKDTHGDAYAKRFWREILARDEKKYVEAALSRFEAYQTRPVKGYEVVLCRDGKTSIAARVFRRCEYLKMSNFKPCALSKKQVRWLRTAHRFIPKTVYQALSAWRTSCRAGNYGLCLRHARFLVTLLSDQPHMWEWLSEDFDLKQWPRPRKVPKMEVDVRFPEPACAALRDWFKALIPDKHRLKA